MIFNWSVLVRDRLWFFDEGKAVDRNIVTSLVNDQEQGHKNTEEDEDEPIITRARINKALDSAAASSIQTA